MKPGGIGQELRLTLNPELPPVFFPQRGGRPWGLTSFAPCRPPWGKTTLRKIATPKEIRRKISRAAFCR